MVGLLDGETILKIRLFVLTQSTNVTDRRTDGHTHRHRMTAKAALDARQKSLSKSHCTVLPPGDFNGMIQSHRPSIMKVL